VGLEWCGELLDLAYGGEIGERLVKEDIFGGKASLASSDQEKPVVPPRAVSTLSA